MHIANRKLNILILFMKFLEYNFCFNKCGLEKKSRILFLLQQIQPKDNFVKVKKMGIKLETRTNTIKFDHR